MAQKTKQQLKETLVNGHLMTGGDFADLLDSLKGVQSVVLDPAASGTSLTFIATITQNAEGVITVTKKTVDFSGYQTVAGMSSYQDKDLQRVGDVTVGAGKSQTVRHNMGHYPTVRLMAAAGEEVNPSKYTVVHADMRTLAITLGSVLTAGSYKYILD